MKKFITIPALALSYLLFIQPVSATGSGSGTNNKICEVYNAQGLREYFEVSKNDTCPPCEMECYNGRTIPCEADTICPDYKECKDGSRVYALVPANQNCPPKDCSSSVKASSSRPKSSTCMLISCDCETTGEKHDSVCYGDECPYCPPRSSAKVSSSLPRVTSSSQHWDEPSSSSRPVSSSLVKSSSPTVSSSSKPASSSQVVSSSLKVSSPKPDSSSKTVSSVAVVDCIEIEVVKITKTQGKNVGIKGDNNSCLDALAKLPQLTADEYISADNWRDYQVFSGVNTCEYVKTMNNLSAKEKNLICELSTQKTGTVTYLSKDCKLMTEAELMAKTFGMTPCVDYAMEVGFITPVSLVWDGAYGDVKPTVTSFPLNPKDKGKFVIWKAGASMPLVVYDPDKIGKITSAEQIFGQYTFGQTWKDGFEALASLDKNKDGKLSGDELKDLSLWFDNNQNGVSEEGEVIDIREAGIVELYYKKDSDNTKDGAIIVTKGYRHENGTTGPAVDWMSDVFGTKEKALEAISGVKTAENNAGADPQENAVPNNATLDNGPERSANFAGIWVWNVDSEYLQSESANTTGIFMFSQKENGVTGRSVVELMLDNNKADIKSAVLSLPVNGTVGSQQLKFKVSNNGLITETTAELGNGGTSMTGVSRSETLNKQTGKKETVHYTWVAKRVG